MTTRGALSSSRLNLDYMVSTALARTCVGSLCMIENPLPRREGALPAMIDILGPDAPGRAEVEAFISGVYARTYGAHIRVTYPTLLSVRGVDGKLLAALGYRTAAEAPLFLETYLDTPVEDAVGVVRGGIVEIGSLAALNGGATVYLYAALMAHLHHHGFTHAVLTATDSLERRLRRMGWAMVRLAPATSARLPDGGAAWGTYYDTLPWVNVGSVQQAMFRLQEMMGVDYVTAPVEQL